MFKIERNICIKMDLVLDNLQGLICHKAKPTNQPTNQSIAHHCLVLFTLIAHLYFILLHISTTFYSHLYLVLFTYIAHLYLLLFTSIENHSPTPPLLGRLPEFKSNTRQSAFHLAQKLLKKALIPVLSPAMNK